MVTPHDPFVQKTLRIMFVIALMTCANMASVAAQGIPPLLEPPPGSTITTDPVNFSGAHTSADLKHLLRIGSSLGGSDLFSKSLGTGHAVTVSGLPSSGPIYVSYWTLNSAGWFVNRVVYTMDVGSGAPRVWNCPAEDVNCLINAITIGNGSGNPEIIQLAAGTYTLESFDNLATFLPRIRGNITVQGAGSTATIIRSNLFSPPLRNNSVITFSVERSATFKLTALSILKGGAVIVNRGETTMHEVTISDGQISPNFFAPSGILNGVGATMKIQDSRFTGYQQTAGNAIRNSGTMEITGSSITDNISSRRSQGAGGIYNESTGTLTIKTSTIARNRGQETSQPGAILNLGHLDLINSLVQDNVGTVGGLSSALGTTNISGSIFTGNRSENNAGGGAIFNSGPMTISKTVIAFNKAAGGGGIFYTGGFGGTLTIENSVIFGNEAENSIGGGIDIVNNGLITLTDTVVTNNTPNDCQGCP